MAIQLLAAGLILLTVESFIPGFGIFGISGILCLLGALYLALGATAQAAALVGGLLLMLVVLGWWLVRRGPGSWLGRHVTPASPFYGSPGLYGPGGTEGSFGTEGDHPDGPASFRPRPDRWGIGGCDHRRRIL